MADNETEVKPPPRMPSVASPQAPVVAPKPKPAAPEPSVAEKARANIATAKGNTSFIGRMTRPFRYGLEFVKGTVGGGLDGVATWGRRGVKWGAIASLVGWMAQASVFVGMPVIGQIGAATAAATMGGVAVLGGVGALITGVAVFALAAFAAGIVLGGAAGLLTGGVKAVGRMHRGEKYAEDLVQRSHVQAQAPKNHADYREALQAQRQRSAYNTQQLLEREAEAKRDAANLSGGSGSWQEREQHRGGNPSRGLGW